MSTVGNEYGRDDFEASLPRFVFAGGHKTCEQRIMGAQESECLGIRQVMM